MDSCYCIRMTAKRIAFFLWEAPQNLLGAVLYGILRLTRGAERGVLERGRLFVSNRSLETTLPKTGHRVED